MAAPEAGWPWTGAPVATHGDADALILARRTARLFATPDGQAVLGHLKEMTIDRCLSPDAGDGALRHLEGQRHLVLHLLALIRRGQAGR